jgi:alkylated DNA nucleotide flippase Atl1
MHYWTVDGEISLRDLGAEAGLLERSGRHIDRNALRAVCERIPPGRWTTYAAVAEAIGVPGAAQSVAGVIATDPSITNAQRVLRSTGRISPGWSATDGGGPDTARKLLEQEGLSFDANDVADPTHRWEPTVAPKAALAANSEPKVGGGVPDPVVTGTAAATPPEGSSAG